METLDRLKIKLDNFIATHKVLKDKNKALLLELADLRQSNNDLVKKVTELKQTMIRHEKDAVNTKKVFLSI